MCNSRCSVDFAVIFFFASVYEKRAGGLKEPGGRDKERERCGGLNQEEQRRNSHGDYNKEKTRDAGGVEKKIELKEKEKGVMEEM